MINQLLLVPLSRATYWFNNNNNNNDADNF